MSNDIVLEALELAKDINGKYPQLYEVYKAQEEFLGKAIAIQKQQAKVIESAQGVRGQWEYSGLSAGDERIVNSMCEELSKLDAMKGEE